MTRNLLAGSAVVASTLALSSSPAYAATWAVNPGGAVTGTNVGNVVASDTVKGTNVTCNSSTATGSARAAAGPATKLVTINTITLDHTNWPSTNECAGPNNLKVIITLSGLPYFLNASGPPAAGVTNGTLTSDHALGIHGSLHANDGCDATVGGSGAAKGTVPGKFTDSTDRLQATAGGNLVVKTVDAECDPTLIAAGDTVSLTGTYQVSPAQSVVFTP